MATFYGLNEQTNVQRAAAVSAKGRWIETDAASIRYVAELIGVDIDSEQAIRWVIALMVLCATHLLSHWGLRLRHAGESG